MEQGSTEGKGAVREWKDLAERIYKVVEKITPFSGIYYLKLLPCLLDCV